jgi:hypothetical protein
MKTIIRFIAVLGTFALSSTAFAVSLDISPTDCSASGTTYIVGTTCWTTNDNSQPNSTTLSTLTGIPAADLNELYKAEVGGSDGPDYTTTFGNTATSPEDATIVWDNDGSNIDCTDGCILVVKDGRQSPAVYVFDISSWNGIDTIYLTEFWVGSGAISNVSIWSGGGGTTVPEPGTLALLGLGLFGMGLIRRRKTS